MRRQWALLWRHGAAAVAKVARQGDRFVLRVVKGALRALLQLEAAGVTHR